MILGVDPGLECTGWCLLTKTRYCDSCGSIRTPKEWPDSQRIAEICAQLLALLVQMRTGGVDVKAASVEQYVYQGERSRNANAFRLSRLVGSIESMYRGEGLTVVGPTRGQALTSIGLPSNADDARAKCAIARLVKSRGGVVPKNEHTRAAYAAAWFAVRRVETEERTNAAVYAPVG